jgi:acyl dehydratase
MINLDVIGKKTEPLVFEYTWRDVILYNLGIGFKETDLEFVYENFGDGLKAFPTFAVIPSMNGVFAVAADLNVNPMMILHGEQKIVLSKLIPMDGKLSTTAEVKAIYDKVKGATVVVETETVDEKGDGIFDTETVIFCRGEGGFGGDAGPKAETYDPPEGKDPDFEITYQTTKNQAAIYRLAGDYNPLHIDPNFAAMGGYDTPILHGLCTYGHCGRGIAEKACGGDVSKFKEFKARFSNVVFPGEAITTKGWDMGDGLYHVQASTQSGIVLNQSYAKVEK